MAHIKKLEEFRINEAKRNSSIYWVGEKDLKTRLISLLNLFANERNGYFAVHKSGHKITYCISFWKEETLLSKYPMFKDMTVDLIAYSSSEKKLELGIIGNNTNYVSSVNFDSLEPDVQKDVYDETIKQFKEKMDEVFVFSNEL